jgi:hypothetical protein
MFDCGKSYLLLQSMLYKTKDILLLNRFNFRPCLRGSTPIDILYI